MDRDEEEGLRAFAVRVGAYAGSASPERPHWVERNGSQVQVAEIEAQWREEERIAWRVRLADGAEGLLYYVPELDLWSGSFSDGTGPPIIRRRQEGHAADGATGARGDSPHA
jgi:hypothetical protein